MEGWSEEMSSGNGCVCERHYHHPGHAATSPAGRGLIVAGIGDGADGGVVRDRGTGMLVPSEGRS